MKLTHFNCGQLQISEQAITKHREITKQQLQNAVSGAMSITINRMIKQVI